MSDMKEGLISETVSCGSVAVVAGVTKCVSLGWKIAPDVKKEPTVLIHGGPTHTQPPLMENHRADSGWHGRTCMQWCHKAIHGRSAIRMALLSTIPLLISATSLPIRR